MAFTEWPLSQIEINTKMRRRLRRAQERVKGCISGHLIGDHMRVNATEASQYGRLPNISTAAGMPVLTLRAVLWCPEATELSPRAPGGKLMPSGA